MDNLHPAQGHTKVSKGHKQQKSETIKAMQIRAEKLNYDAHVVMMVPLTRPP